MELVWLRVEPPLPKSLLVGLKAAGRGILWNGGGGLRLAVPKGFEGVIAEYARVEPCSAPEPAAAKP